MRVSSCVVPHPLRSPTWESAKGFAVTVDLLESIPWQGQQAIHVMWENCLQPPPGSTNHETQVFHQGTFGGSVQLSARSSIDLHESGLKESQFGLVQSEDRQERPWCTRQNALDIMSIHSQYKGLSSLFLRIPIRSEPTTAILPNADQHVWVLELTWHALRHAGRVSAFLNVGATGLPFRPLPTCSLETSVHIAYFFHLGPCDLKCWFRFHNFIQKFSKHHMLANASIGFLTTHAFCSSIIYHSQSQKLSTG